MIFIRQNLVWIILVGISILGLLGWAFLESNNLSKPKPGVEAIQEGRNHIPHGSKTDYKFNPPTSGDHYADWITKGFYDEPREDGSTVHSLEHGYVIINYNCEQKLGFNLNLISEAHAHSEVPESTDSAENLDDKGRTAMTQGSQGVAIVKLANMPEPFRDGNCNGLKDQLKKVYDSNQHKLIVQPRIGMDSPIILTAWGRFLKLNSVDGKQIKEFLSAFRDKGPESTVEP